MNILGHFESEERLVERALELPLGPRSRVSIGSRASRRPPSTVQQQVSIKNKDVVYDGALLPYCKAQFCHHQCLFCFLFAAATLSLFPFYALPQNGGTLR